MATDRTVTDFFAKYKRLRKESHGLASTCEELERRLCEVREQLGAAEATLAESLETEAELQRKHRAVTHELRAEHERAEHLGATLADLRKGKHGADKSQARTAQEVSKAKLRLDQIKQRRIDVQERCVFAVVGGGGGWWVAGGAGHTAQRPVRLAGPSGWGPSWTT